MKRMNVYLGSLRHRAVLKEAKKLGVSAAEVIRGLVDEGLLQRDYEDRRWRKHDRKWLRKTRIN
jgi:hypothetical protein